MLEGAASHHPTTSKDIPEEKKIVVKNKDPIEVYYDSTGPCPSSHILCHIIFKYLTKNNSADPSPHKVDDVNK